MEGFNRRHHIKEIKARIEKTNSTPSHIKKERHGRFVSLFKHGICITGNTVVNSWLDQIYGGKTDNS